MQNSKNPQWNDDQNDLSSMRLTKEEFTKRVAARKHSHNQALVRAEMLERQKNGNARPFSPALSSRLRASMAKSMGDVLSDGSAALSLAQKIRLEERAGQINRELSDVLEKQRLDEMRDSVPLHDPTDRRENVPINDDQESASNVAPLQNSQNDEFYSSDNMRHFAKEHERQQNLASYLMAGGQNPISGESEQHRSGNVAEPGQQEYYGDEEGDFSYSQPPPLTAQGWDNLNGTIQLVVKTCEALWHQLEEERLTRQRLHVQLQEQRSVITTLTAELLQIQDHQGSILNELRRARSSVLTGEENVQESSPLLNPKVPTKNEASPMFNFNPEQRSPSISRLNIDYQQKSPRSPRSPRSPKQSPREFSPRIVTYSEINKADSQLRKNGLINHIVPNNETQRNSPPVALDPLIKDRVSYIPSHLQHFTQKNVELSVGDGYSTGNMQNKQNAQFNVSLANNMPNLMKNCQISKS